MENAEQPERKTEQVEQKTEQVEQDASQKINLSKNSAYFIAIGVVALLVGGLIGANFFPRVIAADVPVDDGSCLPNSNTIITNAEVGQKVEDYINEGPFLMEGVTVKVSSVEDFDDSLYLVKINIMQDGNILQEDGVYATKNGSSIVLGQVFDLDTPLPKPEPQPEPEPQAYTKTEQPRIDMFVMSFCPYGQQAEKGLEPVASLFGENIEIYPHYVIYGPSAYAGKESQYCIEEYCSMHGIGELNEDIRQMCIYKHEKDKFWDYTMYITRKYDAKEWSASNIDEHWEEAANDTGVDVEKIKSCQEEEALELLSQEKLSNELFSVGGSPTIFINGIQYSGARTSDAYKQAICSAFIDPPEECAEELDSEDAGNPTGGCGE